MSHLRVVGQHPDQTEVFRTEQVSQAGHLVPEVPPAPVAHDSITTTDGDLIQTRCDADKSGSSAGFVTLVVGRFEHAQRILHLDRDQARRLVAELQAHLEHQ